MEEPLPWLLGHTIISNPPFGHLLTSWLVDCFAHSFCDHSAAQRPPNSAKCTLINVLWIEHYNLWSAGAPHTPALDFSCLPWAQPPPRALLSPLSPLWAGWGMARQGWPLPDPVTSPSLSWARVSFSSLASGGTSKAQGRCRDPSSPQQPHQSRQQHLLYIVDTIYRIFNFLPTSRQLWK